MGTYTNRRNLYKPDIGETNWGDKVNTNFDIADDFATVTNDIYVAAPFLKPCQSAILDENFVGQIDSNWVIAYTGLTSVSYTLLDSGGIEVTFSGVTTASGGMGGLFVPVTFDKDLEVIMHLDASANFEHIMATDNGTFFAGIIVDDDLTFESHSATDHAAVGEMIGVSYRGLFKNGVITAQVYGQTYIKMVYKHATNTIYASMSYDGVFWNLFDEHSNYHAELTIPSGYIGFGLFVPPQDFGDVIKIYSRKFSINCVNNYTYQE